MYFGTVKGIIRDDRRLRYLLLASLLVQVVVCLTAVGIYHPDQYFQIIEFSSWQLHRPSAAGNVWEFGAHLRPTLQVYLFSAYYSICTTLGIHDPYWQPGLLRLLFGLALFVLFNSICLYYFQRDRRGFFFFFFVLYFFFVPPYSRGLFTTRVSFFFPFFCVFF